MPDLRAVLEQADEAVRALQLPEPRVEDVRRRRNHRRTMRRIGAGVTALTVTAAVVASAAWLLREPRPTTPTTVSPEPTTSQHATPPTGSTAIHWIDGIKPSIVGLGGGTVRTLLGVPPDGHDLTLSPDGSTIAFVSRKGLFTVGLNQGSI